MRDPEIEQFPYHVLDLLHTRVAKLDHFAAVGADNVVVLLVAVRLFILRQVFPELVFFHQVAGHQQFQRIVHRGTAYAVVAVFHMDVQSLGIEVVGAFVNLFQDSEALGGFTKTVFFQLGGKNIEHLLNEFLFVALRSHG